MSGRMQFLKAQWDAVLALFAAIAVTVLSATNTIDDPEVPEYTLGVLTLLCITIVKDRHARSTDVGWGRRVLDSLASIETRQRSAEEVTGLTPPTIGRELAGAWKTATRWRFKGGTGTYLRAQTLPGLVRHSRPADVSIEIIAPDDTDVCKRYGYHRSRPKSQTSDDDGSMKWAPNEVRIEAYATIIAAIWYTQHTTIRAHVALSSAMSSLRYDLCDDFVIVTDDGPDSRALSIDGESGYFSTVEQELRFSFEQARTLTIAGTHISRDIAPDDVRRALSGLKGLRHDDAFLTNDVCSLIARRAISEEHAVELGFDSGGAKNPYPQEREGAA